MTRRFALFGLLLSVAAAGAAAHGASGGNRPNGLVVHEWGTFTSVAGKDGAAVTWLPQQGPPDLPDFVGRINCALKRSLSGTIRMETPVIYFYAPNEMAVNVDVSFREGVITEWFPRPTAATDHTINNAFGGHIAWKNVRVRPGAAPQFPMEARSDHYYVARETDGAPLQVGTEQERFLFYRGVGRLPPPITAAVTPEDQIVVRNVRGGALGDVILFENRDGAMAFDVRHTTADRVAFNGVEPDDEGASPQAVLERILVQHGLYPKEAKAMVDSWRGSWFEHGTRLFYIVSNEAVDDMLPLRVDPAPSEVKRVFVGRVELVTRATLRDVQVALGNGDGRRLALYGRFLEPIGTELLATVPESERPEMTKRLETARRQWMKTWVAPTACQAARPF